MIRGKYELLQDENDVVEKRNLIGDRKGVNE